MHQISTLPQQLILCHGGCVNWGQKGVGQKTAQIFKSNQCEILEVLRFYDLDQSLLPARSTSIQELGQCKCGWNIATSDVLEIKTLRLGEIILRVAEISFNLLCLPWFLTISTPSFFLDMDQRVEELTRRPPYGSTDPML